MHAASARTTASSAGARAVSFIRVLHQPQNRSGSSSTRTPPLAAGEDRDFFLSILNATSTKREARAYLQRFTPPRVPAIVDATTKPMPPARVGRAKETHLATVAAAVEQQVAIMAPALVKEPAMAADEQLHVALVKIRDVASISDSTLSGVGRTLGQLQRLGLLAIVVIDYPATSDETWRRETEAQADRVVAAIEQHRRAARRVDGALTLSHDVPTVSVPKVLLAPLSRGVIPVLTPVAYNSSQRVSHADPGAVVLALTELVRAHTLTMALDRLIFLDPLGGIPAPDRPAGAHVFVNMQQEYSSIRSSLVDSPHIHHLRSLDVIQKALALLPPTSSAVITTPAACLSVLPAAGTTTSPTRHKNPLIHNLLTDKPLFSSSLPTHSGRSTQTTLLKHGTPLRIFGSGTRLSDPKLINLPKLVALIEDSFGKTLDVEHYLRRVDSHIAGIIIAGDYEGAAIVTWEGKKRDVCYLDKFAVLRKSQGVGGVADVVFKAMTANVSPGGVFDGAEGILWRSKRTNVVNKWYFERAEGTYKLKEGGGCWTMFWTTQDEKIGRERFLEYVSVCGGIEPSLKDKTGGVDG